MIASIIQNNNTGIVTLQQAQQFIQKSQLQYLIDEIGKLHKDTQKETIQFVAMYKKHKKQFIKEDLLLKMAGQNTIDNLRKNYDCKKKKQGVNFLVFEENDYGFQIGSQFIKNSDKQYIEYNKLDLSVNNRKAKLYYLSMHMFLKTLIKSKSETADKSTEIIIDLLEIYDDYGDKQYAANQIIHRHQLQITQEENSQLKTDKQQLQQEISQMQNIKNNLQQQIEEAKTELNKQKKYMTDFQTQNISYNKQNLTSEYQQFFIRKLQTKHLLKDEYEKKCYMVGFKIKNAAEIQTEFKYIKIGFTAQTIKDRINQLKREYEFDDNLEYDLVLLDLFPVSSIHLEQQFHSHNKQHISHKKNEYYIICDYILEQYEQFKILGLNQFKEESEMILRLENTIKNTSEMLQQQKIMLAKQEQTNEETKIYLKDHLDYLKKDNENLRVQNRELQQMQQKNQDIIIRITEMKMIIEQQKFYDVNKTLIKNLLEQMKNIIPK